MKGLRGLLICPCRCLASEILIFVVLCTHEATSPTRTEPLSTARTLRVAENLLVLSLLHFPFRRFFSFCKTVAAIPFELASVSLFTIQVGCGACVAKQSIVGSFQTSRRHFEFWSYRPASLNVRACLAFFDARHQDWQILSIRRYRTIHNTL